MTDQKKSRSITPYGGGLFQELSTRGKLILRLLRDGRVNPLLKLLPISTIAYLIIPDLIPFVIDDAAIIWLGTYMFVELCPPAVVQEHMDELKGVIPGSVIDLDESTQRPDVIDGQYREVPVEPPQDPRDAQP